MSIDFIISVIITIVGASTPILLAGLGELVTEKSGVLNLGVEGMMLVGAVAVPDARREVAAAAMRRFPGTPARRPSRCRASRM